MANLLPYDSSPMSKKIRIVQKAAENYFKKKYATQKEQDAHREILIEVKEQIRTCFELTKTVTKEDVYDWIDSERLSYVFRKAHTIKFS